MATLFGKGGRRKFPAATYSPVTPEVTVPSAQEGLTAVFGMGTGVTPPLWRPESGTSGFGASTILGKAKDRADTRNLIDN
jgi:hypothetical protein